MIKKLLNVQLLNKKFYSLKNVNILDKCFKKFPPMNITIAGAYSYVGQIIAFLLKQEKDVKNLFLYDKNCLSDFEDDLNTIPTNCKVTSFTGIKCLPAAIENARIVIICGRDDRIPGRTTKNMFIRNADYVREIIMYCAEFNRQCHICIVTPPVSALVPLAVEECKKADLLNHNRIYGVVTPNVMRAESMLAEELKQKKSLIVPAVGGTSRWTFIPVLSHSANMLAPPRNEILTRNIQEAEQDLLSDKAELEDYRSCFISIANGTVLFIRLLIAALKGEKKVRTSIYVKQDEPIEQISRYLTTYVTLNRCGVAESHIPKLSHRESFRFKQAVNEINDNIHLGESYITGREKVVTRAVKEPKKDEPPLPVMKIMCTPPFECHGQKFEWMRARSRKMKRKSCRFRMERCKDNC